MRGAPDWVPIVVFQFYQGPRRVIQKVCKDASRFQLNPPGPTTTFFLFSHNINKHFSPTQPHYEYVIAISFLFKRFYQLTLTAASYGGYTKTSYGAQGGEEGGGFFSGSQSGSQGAQGGQKVCATRQHNPHHDKPSMEYLPSCTRN